MKVKDIAKVYYKAETPGKTINIPELKKSKVVAWRKTFIGQFDPQCRYSRKEAVGTEHVSNVQKIKKEQKLLSLFIC